MEFLLLAAGVVLVTLSLLGFCGVVSVLRRFAWPMLALAVVVVVLSFVY